MEDLWGKMGLVFFETDPQKKVWMCLCACMCVYIFDVTTVVIQ